MSQTQQTQPSDLPITGSVSSGPTPISDEECICDNNCAFGSHSFRCHDYNRPNRQLVTDSSGNIYPGLSYLRDLLPPFPVTRSSIVRDNNSQPFRASRVFPTGTNIAPASDQAEVVALENLPSGSELDRNLIAPFLFDPVYSGKALNFGFEGNNTGRINKNVGPAEWAKMSYLERTAVADITGFVLDSVTLYSRCKILKINKDNRNVTWTKRLSKTLTNDNAGHFLRQMDLEDRTMTLQTALILKSFNVNYNLPDICGVMKLQRAGSTITAQFDEDEEQILEFQGDRPLQFEMFDNLSLFSVKTLPKVIADKIEKSLSDATSEVKKTTDSINMMVESLVALLPDPSMANFIREQGLHIVAFIMDLAKSLYTGTLLSNILSLCVRLVGIIGIPSTIVSTISDYLNSARTMVSNRAPARQGLEFQANESPGSIIAAIMGVMISGTALTASGLKQVGEMSRLFNTMVMSSGKIETLLSGLITWLPLCVRAWLTNLFPSLASVDMPHLISEYRRITTDVELLLDNHVNPMIVFDFDYRRLVARFHPELRDLYRKLEEKTADPMIRTFAMRVFKLEERLRKISEEIRMLELETVGRPTPYCMTFYGDSGVGKSTVALKIANKYAPSEAKEQRVYVRNAVDDFWSGYHNQDFVVIDDQGQETVRHTDLNEMFSMVSTASYCPPMASIDNAAVGVKGTKFTSKAIFVCTNNPFPAATGLYLKTALNRRRVLVRVTLADEFKTTANVPDPSKFPADFSHLRFAIMDSIVENKMIGVPMDYTNFCEFFEINIATHYDRENRVFNKSSDETERKPLMCFEGYIIDWLFSRGRFPIISENTAMLYAGDIKNVTSGQLDQFAHYCFAITSPALPKQQIFDYDFNEATCALIMMNRDDFKFIADLISQFGFFDYPMRREFLSLYDDGWNFEQACFALQLFILKNFHQIPITAFTTVESLKFARSIIRCGDSPLVSMLRNHQEMKKCFVVKHPYLVRIMDLAFDASIVATGVAAIFGIWKWLSPANEIVAFQSYDRSEKNQFAKKRKAPTYVIPTRGAIRYESMVVSATDVKKSDGQPLIDFLVKNKVGKEKALDITTGYLNVCAQMRAALDPEQIGRMRNGPDTDDARTALNAAVESTPVKKLVEKHGTSLVLEGLVTDFFHVDHDAVVDDQLRHLTDLGFSDVELVDVVDAIAPVTNALREALEGVPEEDKELIQQEFSTIISDSFRLNPEVVALSDGSLACQSFSHGRRVTFVDSTPVKLQGSDDRASIDIIEKCVLPYTLYLESEYTGLCAFPIGGKDLLVPNHFWIDRSSGKLHPDGMMFSVRGSSDYFLPLERFERKRLRVLSLDGKPTDVSIYRCSSRLRSYRFRYDMFIKDSDLPHLASLPGSLITSRSNLPIVNEINMYLTKSKSTVQSDEGVVLLEVPKCWRYSAQTSQGMCGGLLVAHKSSMPRKFLGIHFASGRASPMSFGQIVTQEMINPAIESLNTEYGEPVEGVMVGQDLEDVENARVYFEGDFSRYGTVARGEEVRPATKTQLEPSIIQGVFPVKRMPAALIPSDPRISEEHRGQSLIAKSVAKYGKMSKPFEEELVDTIVEDIFITIGEQVTHVPIRDATMEEAINGNMHIPHCERLNLHTSAGYPFVLIKQKGTTGKHGWFEGTDEERVMVPSLRRIVERRLTLAGQGERVPSIWVDNMKDELRPVEKVLVGGTRTFTIGPMDYTIAFRKLFLMFCCHFMAAKLKFFSAIGMDPESQDWTIAEERMREVSDIGFAGDYSRWDGVMSAQIMDSVCNHINKWYGITEENTQSTLARRVLFDEMIHTPVLCINLLYGQHGGNPSGNPMTAIINTIVNAVYLRYAYMKLAPKHLRDLCFFNRYVRDLIYGDDNRISAPPKILEFYNMHTVSKFFATLGITYTSAQKQLAEDVPAFEPLENLTFLKRGFRLQGKTWLPLMAEDTIFDLCNWIRKCDDPVDACIENCNTALRFRFHFGRASFNDMRRKLVDAFLKANIRPNLFNFEYFNNYFEEYSCLPPVDMSLEDEETVLEFQSGPTPEKNAIKNALTNASNQHGQILMEPNGVARAAPYHGDTLRPMMQDSSFISAGDQRWTMEDAATRYTFLGKFDWNTSDGVLTSKAFFDLPKDMLTSAMNQMPFQYFLLYNGEIRVRFDLPGTPFHQGMLAVYFIPHYSSKLLTAFNTYQSLISSVAHVFLEGNKSGSVEIIIPFSHFRDFISLSDESATTLIQNSLGALRCVVFNQLRAGTGASTSLPVSMFVSFSKESRFAVPIGREPVARTLAFQAGMGGMLSTFFAPIISKIMPKNIIADTIDKLGGGNRDFPNNPAQPHYVIVRTSKMGYLSNATQVGQMEVLSYDPSEQHDQSLEAFKATVDETDLSYLFDKMTFVSMSSWDISEDTNTILMDGFLKPFDIEERLMEAGGSAVQAGVAHYIASLHSEWRGPLRFRIQIVAGNFHAGKLYFGVHYGRTTTPTTITSAMDQFGITLDLNSGQRDFIIEIPYNALTKWLYIPNGRGGDITPERSSMGRWSLRVLNRLTTPAGIPSGVEINLYTGVGKNFQVRNPGLTNWSVQQLTFQSGPRDWSMGYQAGGITDHDTPWGAKDNEMSTIDSDAPTSNASNEKSGGDVAAPELTLNQSNDQTTQFVVTRSKPARRFGTGCLYPVATLTQYLKRPVPIGQPINFNNPVGAPLITFPAVIVLSLGEMIWGKASQSGSSGFTHVKNSNTFWNNITNMYRWASGSLRFKVVIIDEKNAANEMQVSAIHYRRHRYPRNNENAASLQMTAAACTPWAQAYTTGIFSYANNNSEALCTATGTTPTLEFEVPWTSIYNFNLNRTDGMLSIDYDDSNIFSSGLVILTVQSSVASTPAAVATDFTAAVWISAGDDFHLGGFLGVPPITAVENVNSDVGYQCWPDNYYVDD